MCSLSVFGTKRQNFSFDPKIDQINPPPTNIKHPPTHQHPHLRTHVHCRNTDIWKENGGKTIAGNISILWLFVCPALCKARGVLFRGNLPRIPRIFHAERPNPCQPMSMDAKATKFIHRCWKWLLSIPPSGFLFKPRRSAHPGDTPTPPEGRGCECRSSFVTHVRDGSANTRSISSACLRPFRSCARITCPTRISTKGRSLLLHLRPAAKCRQLWLFFNFIVSSLSVLEKVT